MSMRYKGGIISATAATTTSSAASGVWTRQQQLQAIAGSGWPAQAYPFWVNSYQVQSSGNIVVDDSSNVYFAGNIYSAGVYVPLINKLSSTGSTTYAKTLVPSYSAGGSPSQQPFVSADS
jgi:hypothetical protein